MTVKNDKNSKSTEKKPGLSFCMKKKQEQENYNVKCTHITDTWLLYLHQLRHLYIQYTQALEEQFTPEYRK